MEHIAQMGTLVTDFTLIKAGALHRANGGYLVLDALKVLTQPFAWEALKRTLRAREIRTESLGQALSLVSTVSLAPEPIPLDVKVVLVGPRTLYYLLHAYDPEFAELFKIGADFEEDLPRGDEEEARYARLVATLARRGNLRPLDAGAVARVIEQAARGAGEAAKLSANLEALADLLRESDYWAAAAGRALVEAADVERAIAAQRERAGRLRDRVREAILKGTLLIDTAGARIGQVNGLAVTELGGYAFGIPHRITARVRLGGGRVVDIERESQLGGPIHSKGVLILSGFLSARYAARHPLALSASLVFEQSYGGVEGDSASAAELCALLSGARRGADLAGDRDHRLGQPARRHPGGGRGERKNRGVLRRVRRARLGARARRDHSGGERAEPDAARRRRRSGRRGALCDLAGEDGRRGGYAAHRHARRRARRARRIPRRHPQPPRRGKARRVRGARGESRRARRRAKAAARAGVLSVRWTNCASSSRRTARGSSGRAAGRLRRRARSSCSTALRAT
ncbi:MAG: ATP-binding protein [Burkholderiales bacterium]|nr:ATP-binding protein [Burkholderiales bacterium]